MALADDASTYSADALALLLARPGLTTLPARPLVVPGLPPQADVDRLLSVYEVWVQIDVALPEVRA